MKLYGIYKLTGETRSLPATASDAYGYIMVDNCADLISQHCTIEEASKSLSKFHSRFREDHYVITTYFCEVYFIAKNENLGDEDEEDVHDGDAVMFSEFQED